MKTRRTVIVNTSPLYYLHKLECLECLAGLYGSVTVPEAVAAELEEGKKAGEGVPCLSDYPWIHLRKVMIPAFIKMVPDLGRGEAEVLALGAEEEDTLIVVDDGLARRIAKLQGFTITGTAGVLLKAKKQGLVKEIRPMLVKLKESGFYLKEEIVSEILKIAGES